MDKTLLRPLQPPILVNPIRIGSYTIPDNVILAPMAGCTDLAQRLICRDHGARFCFFEMLDANSLIRRRNPPLEVLESCAEDRPIAGQILGRDPQMMLDAALKLLQLVDIPFIDINFACPVRKVIRKKAGAYLLRDLSTMSKIIEKLSSGLPIPVTVKLRVGYDRHDLNEARVIAKRCRDAGAKAIFVHGRLATQLYHGNSDNRPIKAMKDAVDIPVFASGDIFGRSSIEDTMLATGCDGVLVARGSLGNPWIFSGGPEPDLATKKEALKKHLSYIMAYRHTDQRGKVAMMRKAALWYIKAFPFAAKMRGIIASKKTHESLVELIDGIV